MNLEDRLEQLLHDLVACNSVSPSLAGGPGEAALAAYIAGRLEALGLRPEVRLVEPGRPNVVASIPGRASGPTILLNAHLDTVGVDGMDNPFVLRRDGDQLYGRGAYDMKGSIAVMLLIAERFVAEPPPGDVLLTFVADEEDRSAGMEQLVRQWLPSRGRIPDAAIVLEPTEEAIGIAHKGFVWQEIEIAGRPAHGSRPEQGVDAVFPLAAALQQLCRIAAELSTRPPHPLLGHATLHVGTLRGGSAWSVIPDRSRLGWERRTLPGEDRSDLDRELERVVRAVRTYPGDHRVEGRTVFEREPLEVDAESLPVRLLRAVRPDIPTGGVSFWADSALIGEHVPTVLFGPVGHGAHATDEWVSARSLTKVLEVLTEMIRRSGDDGRRAARAG